MKETANGHIDVAEVPEHTVEIITNSGEGAQKCAQIFGQTCAKMGNGVWTVEIIPAEIEPPHHTVTSTSGNIIRFGTDKVFHVDVAFPLDGDDGIDDVQILFEAKRSF